MANADIPDSSYFAIREKCRIRDNDTQTICQDLHRNIVFYLQN